MQPAVQVVINRLSNPELDFVFAIVDPVNMESLTEIHNNLKALYLEVEQHMIGKSNVEKLRVLLPDIDEIYQTLSEKIASFLAVIKFRA